jgi:hypothetical protein
MLCVLLTVPALQGEPLAHNDNAHGETMPSARAPAAAAGVALTRQRPALPVFIQVRADGGVAPRVPNHGHAWPLALFSTY